MTGAYPVTYTVAMPARFTRLQLLIRVLAFGALGVLGLSFGTVFVFAYLALPLFAASRLAAGRTRNEYVGQEGTRILVGLRWFAALSAWAGLIAEHLPGSSPAETVQIEIEATGHPTPASATWRIVSGIPSALALAVLGFLGMFVWVWAALSILFVQRIGPEAFHYLVGLQRWSIRLLAYQASLVDTYPPFSFAAGPARRGHAHVAP